MSWAAMIIGMAGVLAIMAAGIWAIVELFLWIDAWERKEGEE